MAGSRNAKKVEVSICIPAFNNPHGLRRTLASVTNQIFQDLEVIITDDSTTDEVSEVANEFRDKFIDFTYVRNKNRKGSPGNWNECIERASGKFIKIIHHDDWFSSPNSLKSFVAKARSMLPNDVVIFSSSEAVSPRGKRISLNKPEKSTVELLLNDPRSLLEANIIGAPSSVLYTNHKGISFDEKLIWLVDVDFYLQLLKKGFSLGYLTETLVSTTAGSRQQITSSVQNDPNIELYENMYLYDKWHPLISRGQLATAKHLLSKYNITTWKEMPSISLSLKSIIIIRSIIFARKYLRH